MKDRRDVIFLPLKMEEGDYKPRNVEKHLESRKKIPLGACRCSGFRTDFKNVKLLTYRVIR